MNLRRTNPTIWALCPASAQSDQCKAQSEDLLERADGKLICLPWGQSPNLSVAHISMKVFVMKISTVMTLSFWTDRSWQTVQIQIRLFLEEQSDQGLHCLLFHLHLFDKMPYGLASL